MKEGYHFIQYISFENIIDYRTVQPKKTWDYLSTSKNNGNNVDIEVETMNLMENQLLYQTISTVLTHKFNRLNIVLR